MKVLLDTCAWLWWVGHSERLGAEIRALVSDARTDVLLSSVVSWEVTTKHALGRLRLPGPPGLLVSTSLVADHMTALPIEHAHTLQVGDLPPLHADPFDRLLIAQARVERVPVVTTDPVFRRYGIEVIDAKK